MKHLRIALLCQHYYPDLVSTGLHMTDLAEVLAARGISVTVICGSPVLSEASAKGLPSRSTRGGVAIERVAGARTYHYGMLGRGLSAVTLIIASAWRVLRRRSDYDGVVVTTDPPFIGLVGWLFSRVFQMRYVAVVYDVYPDTAIRLGVVSADSVAGRLWNRATRAILNRAERVVVIGRDMQRVIAKKLAADRHGRIRLIANWTNERTVRPVDRDCNDFRREHGLSGHYVVQYSGRLGRTHNIEPLVEAAAELENEGVVVQIIGDGAKGAALRRLARSRNVQFLPYQPLDRLAQVLAAADLGVVCLGSSFTGLSVPSKAYGILAAGVPVLGMLDEDSEIGRMLVEHDCGVVVPNATAADIVRVVRRLRAEPGRDEQLGRNARSAFLAHYTLARAAGEYEALLRETFLPRAARVVMGTRS
jgi:glycosyltransferase involved in cell wall biosynthesis